MKNIIDLDALILGGGIAGLWLARRLQLAGYRVVLLENQKLGGGQTLASQGIIHGGLKYALLGQVNETARRIA
ncbi:MAG TPA: FAD-dependent oxidoreductase, partial [Alphaproteobacteria bacterium]|nr:FAD-dependent oxidoreductase [Alphaproteobacteria bacterium]